MISISSAGGVSALLQIADHPSGKAPLRSYDGNIAALLNADTGGLAAAYDGARQRGDGPTARLARRAPPCRHRPSGGRARQYTAFGEPLRAQCFDPTMADNPFRFSTKFVDSETGLVYYGQRYYTPREGRFINQDPIEESGGLNLYGFVLNDPVNRWDYLGMEPAAYPPEPQFTAGDYDDWLDEEYADWLQEMRHLERAWEREMERAVMGGFDDSQFSNPGMDYSVYVNGEFQGTVSSLGATSYQLAEHVLNNPPSEVAVASSTGQTSVNATGPNGDSPTEAQGAATTTASTPVNGGSSLGDALRNIPLVGGLLGGVGDVVSGFGNVALGALTLGASGTLETGFSQIGSGVGGAVTILATDAVATVAGAVGTVVTTATAVADVVTLGNVVSSGNPLKAISNLIKNVAIPEYGMFGGLGWGTAQDRGQNAILNQGDVASYSHDLNRNEIQWIKTNYSTNPQGNWVGPMGAAYALLGTIPFGIKGLIDGEHFP